PSSVCVLIFKRWWSWTPGWIQPRNRTSFHHISLEYRKPLGRTQAPPPPAKDSWHEGSNSPRETHVLTTRQRHLAEGVVGRGGGSGRARLLPSRHVHPRLGRSLALPRQRTLPLCQIREAVGKV